MAFRFRKSFKVAPGVRLNVSKSGVSTTVGKKGLSINTGKKGTYLNAGLPGTGLSTRTKLGGGKTKAKAKPVVWKQQKPKPTSDKMIHSRYHEI